MDQGKEFKTIPEQIEYLKEKRNIQFDDVEEAKEFLLNNNYYNVISSAKIRFAVGIDANGHRKYETSNFSDWVKFYKEDVALSKRLIEKVINLEKGINSRAAYYISELIHKNMIDEVSKLQIALIINKDHPRVNYIYNETWTYITKSTFGTVVKLIESVDTKTQKQILPAGYSLKKIKELRNLRNNLFHLTPLAVYLTTEDSVNHRSKEGRFILVSKILPEDESLQKIIEHSKNFNLLTAKRKPR